MRGRYDRATGTYVIPEPVTTPEADDASGRPYEPSALLLHARAHAKRLTRNVNHASVFSPRNRRRAFAGLVRATARENAEREAHESKAKA